MSNQLADEPFFVPVTVDPETGQELGFVAYTIVAIIDRDTLEALLAHHGINAVPTGHIGYHSACFTAGDLIKKGLRS